VDIVLSSSKKTHLSLVLCPFAIHPMSVLSGQNRNDLGQLPNSSIVLQEVVVLLCVESVFVVLLLWLVSWLLFCGHGGRGVGEEWERSPPGSFFFIF
jgi:hypothetical protein